jgi:hypothetical protein
MSMGWDQVSAATQTIYGYGEPQWNDTDRGNQVTQRKTRPIANLSTTSPIWTDPGANPGLHIDRPATNHLSLNLFLTNVTAFTKQKSYMHFLPKLRLLIKTMTYKVVLILKIHLITYSYQNIF